MFLCCCALPAGAAAPGAIWPIPMGFWNTELPDWTVEDPWRLVPLPTTDPAELGAVALPSEPPPIDPVPEPLDVPPPTPPVPIPLDTPPPLAPPVPWARPPQGVHRREEW